MFVLCMFFIQADSCLVCRREQGALYVAAKGWHSEMCCSVRIRCSSAQPSSWLQGLESPEPFLSARVRCSGGFCCRLVRDRRARNVCFRDVFLVQTDSLLGCCKSQTLRHVLCCVCSVVHSYSFLCCCKLERPKRAFSVRVRCLNG